MVWAESITITFHTSIDSSWFEKWYPCTSRNSNTCELTCFVLTVPSLNYIAVGCYKDTANRAIPILEGKDPILDGHYSHRLNAIGKCAVAALKKKYRIFAVQHGGQCFGGANAERTFHKYGKSTSCGKDGEGGAWANQVYLTKGTGSNSYSHFWQLNIVYTYRNHNGIRQ